MSSFFKNTATDLRDSFKDLGFKLKSSHAHTLVSAFFGYTNNNALIADNASLEYHKSKVEESEEKIESVINGMRNNPEWIGEISSIRIYNIIKNIVDQYREPIYLIYPDDIRYLYSPNLIVSINKNSQLIATYRNKFRDREYVRYINNESFIIEKPTSVERVLEYLDSHTLEEEQYEPSIIIVRDIQIKYSTAIKRDREKVKELLQNL